MLEPEKPEKPKGHLRYGCVCPSVGEKNPCQIPSSNGNRCPRGGYCTIVDIWSCVGSIKKSEIPFSVIFLGGFTNTLLIDEAMP